jgi:pyruvate formate-lyase/glycerol dehydratase family glycyl radical enzyme
MQSTLQYAINIDVEDVLKPNSIEYQKGQQLKNRIISVKPHVCIERARIVTRIYKQTENEHILVRASKAFDAVLKEMSIFILEDEMIVGHQSSMQRSAPLFPEFSVEWIADEIDLFETRAQDKFIVTADVKREFLKDILPYWKGKTLNDRLMPYMTEDIRMLRFDTGVFTLGIHESGGLGHVLLDYEKVLKQGLEGIKTEIRAYSEALDAADPQSISKKRFYHACLSVCDSVIAFAGRYANEADRLASQCEDPLRRRELLEIARICRKVPAQPAGSFYEALQSFWFVQLVPQIYDNGVSVSPGRFDQYMYPYYSTDIANGILTKPQAQRLLEALWVKFTEPIKLYKKDDASFFAGYPMGQNLVIGGTDARGLDATNDLSYRCLEAHRHILLMQPNFSVRLHSNSPYAFIVKVVESIKLGNGMPQIVFDELFVNSLMKFGVSLKEARDYALVGCVEATPKNTWGRYNGGYINLVKILELAINEGKCLITGKQAAPSAGKPEDFACFDDVIEAYKRQVEYCVKRLVIWNNIVDMIHEECMPTPFTSMLIGGCIASGKDVTSGGAKYNWTGPSGIGIANVGDSLYAIKKAVFIDKTLTMRELVNHLRNDFSNDESLRNYLWNRIEKYGNDIREVDELAKLAVDIFLDELEKYNCYRNGPFIASLLPVSSYVAFGLTTGATPDGRHAGQPIADGISPQNGADKNGPTAAAKSVAMIDQVRCANGIIFNQKFSPTSFSSPESTNRFIDLLFTYSRMGGGHIQFNMVTADTLRKAQKNPSKYAGLVVRVAGYSAFFNELTTEIQDSIITRTEHTI